MKKVYLYLSILVSLLTIFYYFGFFPNGNAEEKFIGIKGNNNKDNIIIKNSGTITISKQSEKYLIKNCKDKYLIKAEHYGAINLDVYDRMIIAIEKNDENELQNMIKEGVIHKFYKPEIGCPKDINDISFYKYCKKLYIPSLGISLWIPDKSLEKIE